MARGVRSSVRASDAQDCAGCNYAVERLTTANTESTGMAGECRRQAARWLGTSGSPTTPIVHRAAALPSFQFVGLMSIS
jgi:hypothetical protein